MASAGRRSTQMGGNPPHSLCCENLHYVRTGSVSQVVDNVCPPHGNISEFAEDHFTLWLLNVRSVCNKAGLLCEYTVENDYDVGLIVCLADTWLEESGGGSVVTSQLLPAGYGLGHAPRKKGREGGLVIVCKSRLMAQMQRPQPTASMECMETDLTCASQKLPFCLIYRPPNHFGSACPEEFAGMSTATRWHQSVSSSWVISTSTWILTPLRCWHDSTVDGAEGCRSGAPCAGLPTHQGPHSRSGNHSWERLASGISDNGPSSSVWPHGRVVLPGPGEATNHFHRHTIPYAEQDWLRGFQATHRGAGADVGRGISWSQGTHYHSILRAALDRL